MGFSIFGIWFGRMPKACPVCKGKAIEHSYGNFAEHKVDCEKNLGRKELACEWQGIG